MFTAVDTNILTSFFMKGSKIRAMLLSLVMVSLSPSFALMELGTNRPWIMERAKINKSKFSELTRILSSVVRFVPLEEYASKLSEAKDISPDPDDIDFFAVALLLDAIIWSQEKRLKKQDKVEVLNISEMEHLLSLIE